MRSSDSITHSSGLIIAVVLLAIASFVPIASIFGQASDNNALMSNTDTTTGAVAGTNITNNNSSSMTLDFSAPLLIEHTKVTDNTSISENTTRLSITGNGTFMLPGGNNVSTIVSELDIRYALHGFSKTFGYVFFQTLDGKENASALYVEFKPDNSNIGTGTAFIQTNSTGQLAPLNNALVTFRDQHGSPTNTVTFWKWS